jgi:protein-S-isoprenylcysteine O-methyltransferase Ste14
MIKGLPLSIILAVIVAVFMLTDFYFLSQHDRNRKEGGKGWSWDYTLFLLGMGLFLILQPIILPGIGFHVDNIWGLVIQALGGIGVLAGLILHIWARKHLQHFYTERVEVQPDHKVIDTGPYAMVRHPVFTSFFLLAYGVFFINPAITTLLIVIYTVWAFTASAKEEEKLLSEKVPGYTDYLKRTSRFWPHFWRK